MQSGRLPGRLDASRHTKRALSSLRGIWDMKGQCFLSSIGCKMEMMTQRREDEQCKASLLQLGMREAALAQLSGK